MTLKFYTRLWPELGQFVDARVAQRRLSRALWRSGLEWICILWICALGVFRWKIHALSWLENTALLYLGPLALTLAFRWRVRRLLQRDLAEFGPKQLCPECDYDLTGNTSGVCPECGTALPNAQRRPQTDVAADQGTPGGP